MRFLKIFNTFKSKLNMSVFTQILNPITGKSEWQFQDENYDYHQEIARAAFADMLHDTERNQKYYKALKKTIDKVHSSGKKANVLDIGTGTGLLSMMAVKCGADTVTACEAFMPMAHCAEKIITSNGMKEKINLIKKRSTDIIVGDSNDSDMKFKCNILVTELFDTELIGEGAIGIYNHAHANLLTDDCIAIPTSASIYAQVAESSKLLSFNKVKLLPNLDGDILINTPKNIQECSGEPSVFDVQLSQLKPSVDHKLLTEPLKIFNMNFSSKTPIKEEEGELINFKAINHGNSDVIFFWWDIKMDIDGEILLSCAPYWVHPNFENLSTNQELNRKPIQNRIPWRDHWLQGIYFLKKPQYLQFNDSYTLNAHHDEYSFWFDIDKKNDKITDLNLESPSCSCGLHLAYSRNRIAQMNDSLRNKKFIRILENEINKDSIVLSLSEGSIIGLTTIPLGAKKLYCFEPNQISRRVLESYINFNNLKNVKLISNFDEIDDEDIITNVIAEPYYTTSILPWDNFYFGVLLEKLRKKLNMKVKYFPLKAIIYFLSVEFLDLHKIRTPIVKCEGFDMDIFDKFIDNSYRKADNNIEAQPLWEYPCIALGNPCEALTIDFEHFSNNLEKGGSLQIEMSGECNGIACWIDWVLDNTKSGIISTGPTNTIEIGKYVSWDMFTRQGVHLMYQPRKVQKGNLIKWQGSFSKESGEFKINFEFNEK